MYGLFGHGREHIRKVKEAMKSFKEFLSEDPYLRSAVKHGGKLHLGNQGEPHADIIHKHKAFDNYTKGYVNHKGHFLDSKKANEYAAKHDLHDQGEVNRYGRPSVLVTHSLKKRDF